MFKLPIRKPFSSLNLLIVSSVLELSLIFCGDMSGVSPGAEPGKSGKSR